MAEKLVHNEDGYFSKETLAKFMTITEMHDTKDEFVEKVARECIADMTDEVRIHFIGHPETHRFHFGYGMYIRNKYIHGKNLGFIFIHADELSSEIIKKIIDLVNQKYLEEVERTMGIKVSIDDIYKAVVERILSSKERIRIEPSSLVIEVCRDKFGLADSLQIESAVDESEGGWDVFFTLFHLLRAGTKEYGYKMRAVPIRDGIREGMPYDFEYYFTPPPDDHSN